MAFLPLPLLLPLPATFSQQLPLSLKLSGSSVPVLLSLPRQVRLVVWWEGPSIGVAILVAGATKVVHWGLAALVLTRGTLVSSLWKEKMWGG